MVATTTPLAPKVLDAFADLLSTRRAAVAHCAEALRSEAIDALRRRDLSDLFDQDEPSVESDASTGMMLADWIEQRLREFDEALTRITDGTFGSCIGCGAGIPLERLQALPAAANCVECSRSSHATGHLSGADYVAGHRTRDRFSAGGDVSIPGGVR